MKRLAVFALMTLSLAACQKKTAETTDTKTDTAATTPSSAVPSSAVPSSAIPSAAATPAISKAGAVPAGYTLVPELSKTAVTTFSKPPAPALQDGKDYYALIDSSRGQVLVDLLEKDVPVTVNNFVTLARNHYYDGQRFHRVIDNFMAQTGDPGSKDEAKKASWGTGGPGYSFPDEIRTKLIFDKPGMLAMANSGANTNGSQFFITFAPAEFLNGKYNLFGKVVTGQDILAKLTRTAVSGQGGEVPIPGAVPDRLLSVRILTKG
ncbi:peptidylprolyl isomerase [Deinococcus sp.]|uniref:peptidylprolyl isomerase n=1 Tax=Deinococcus sp. TaxID=47478 RepID=UPI0025F49379|nr:peptidylprolyl isomerase [Deinococcus sp.]